MLIYFAEINNLHFLLHQMMSRLLLFKITLTHTQGALFVSNFWYLFLKKFGDDKGLNIQFCFVHNHLPQSFVEPAFLEKEQTPRQTRTIKGQRMKAQTKSRSQCPRKEQVMIFSCDRY